jgi:hypothetical protein
MQMGPVVLTTSVFFFFFLNDTHIQDLIAFGFLKVFASH